MWVRFKADSSRTNSHVSIPSCFETNVDLQLTMIALIERSFVLCTCMHKHIKCTLSDHNSYKYVHRVHVLEIFA